MKVTGPDNFHNEPTEYSILDLTRDELHIIAWALYTLELKKATLPTLSLNRKIVEKLAKGETGLIK